MAASSVNQGAPLLSEPTVEHVDFDVLSLATSSSDSFSLCLSISSRSATPSPTTSPHCPCLAGWPPRVSGSAPSSPSVAAVVQSAFAQWFTPLASPCQQTQQPCGGDVYAMQQEPQVFELEDDALIQCDLTSSLSLHYADDAAVAESIQPAASRDYKQRLEYYTPEEVNDRTEQWDGDSDCSDVSSTFSNTDTLAVSTSLPTTFDRLATPIALSSLPLSLPSLSPMLGSSSVVSQWLRFHGFPAAAQRRLSGYTCSDLLALTKDDAKELLGIVEGIRLYHRLRSCKQRATLHRNAAIDHTNEDDSKYATDDFDSSDDSQQSSALSSPRLIPPSAFTALFRHRTPAAGSQYATGGPMRCGVAGCGCGVVESSHRWLVCVECGCMLCCVHACKSLWTSVVYCPECYASAAGWVGGLCVIA